MCVLVAGFSVETVDYKNTSFTVWDVGGRCKLVSVNVFVCLFLLQASMLRQSAIKMLTLLHGMSVEEIKL